MRESCVRELTNAELTKSIANDKLKKSRIRCVLEEVRFMITIATSGARTQRDFNSNAVINLV